MNCKPNINNALVYDIGLAMIRAGHAGEGFPSISQPSCVATKPNPENGELNLYFNDNYLYSNTQHFDVSCLVNESYFINDPTLFTNYLNWTYNYLSVDPTDRNVLFTRPAHLASSDHNLLWSKNLCEICFETIGHPSVCITPDATLASYAHCVQTSLVVDFGWSCVRVIPVLEGKIQPDCAQVHPIGGLVLSQLLCEQLKSRLDSTMPNEKSLNPEKNENALRWSEGQVELYKRKITTDIIHTCCTFARNTIDEDYLYFLPGQSPADMKREMKLMSSLHFQLIGEDDKKENLLPELIKKSIDLSPDDYKRNLWNNIVTSGGFSSLNSFIAKLQNELKKIADPTFDVKVHYPMHQAIAGDFLVWTGGSIFASSSIFPNFCVSKSEYQENGESIVRVKCS